ncbi:phage tail assembly chaperone [Rhizomicrobium palustre]
MFWALSLPEWRALTCPPPRASLTRADLGALMQLYPD